MDIDGGGPDLDATQISFMGHSLGGIVGSSFVAYSDNVNSAALANPGGGIAKMLDASLTFGPRVRAGLSAAGIDVNGPDYQTFLFAAQTVIDSSDPTATSSIAVANNIPTLMLQNLGDSVVPNSAPGAPLSGTEPMAAALGLVDVVATTPGEFVAGSRLFSKLNGGLHSTVLSPADATGAPTLLPYTTEMQTHIASFIGSGGAGVTVVDPSLLD
jgi:pimeloyl-ACP methyl ester carboxylesterase